MKYLILLLIVVGVSFASSGDKYYFNMKKHAFEYYDHGKEKQAIVYVKSFLKTYPKNIRAKNLLAVFYYWQGKKDQAKKLLTDILKVEDFKPAKKLLAKIDKNYSPKAFSKKANNSVEKDLDYMLKYVRKNPENIADRKFLVNYFISVNDTKRAIAMAKEILRVNPDDIEMLAFIKKEGVMPTKNYTKPVQSAQTKDEAITILNDYYQANSYDRFINLYKALNDKREYIPSYIHLQALNAAVSLHKYPLAKKILLENNFEPSVHLQEFKELIDQKLKLANLYLVD